MVDYAPVEVKGMRLDDIWDYFALRRHIRAPWAFLRLRKRPFEGSHHDVEFRDGGTFRLRAVPMDRHVFHRMFARDEYHLGQYPPGSFDTIIDIGAHIGTFAVRVAPLAKRILSYEIDPKNFEMASRNTARFPHIKVHSLGVSGSRGQKTLYLGNNPSVNSLHLTDRTVGTLTVNTVSLADILTEHRVERCDLLKMDCEGAEYEIAYSLPDEFWPRIRRLCMEYHPVPNAPANWNGDALAEHLRGRGFRVALERSKRHEGEGLMFAAR